MVTDGVTAPKGSYRPSLVNLLLKAAVCATRPLTAIAASPLLALKLALL